MARQDAWSAQCAGITIRRVGWTQIPLDSLLGVCDLGKINSDPQ